MLPQGPARISPLLGSDRAPAQAALVSAQERIPAPNMFHTLLRHDRLLQAWLPLARELLMHGTLPGRVRELAVMRVAARCGSEYEWAQHLPLAARCGLSSDEIRDVALALDARPWAEADLVLLEAVDALVDDHDLRDETWSALLRFWSDVQLIELLMLVGQYVLVAGVTNSLRVQVEPEKQA